MVDPVLKSLVVRRFRSIPAETVIFDNPTFLVGENGSGKSNLRDAIDFMAEAMSSPLQSVFQRRGGFSVVRNRTPGRRYPENLGLAAVLGPLNGEIEQARYGFEVAAAANYGFKVVREECIVYFNGGRKAWFDRGADAFRSNVGGLKPAIEPASLGLPIIGGEASFAPVLRTLAAMRSYSIEPSQLRRLQDRDGGTGLKADGSNAASVLQEIASQAPEDLTQIYELLAAIAPHTTKVEPVERGSKLGLEFTQEWGPERMKFEASSMSDGTLRALGLLIAAYQHPAPTVLLIEEPEATIHAGAVGVVHDILRGKSEGAGCGDHTQPRLARREVDPGFQLEDGDLARGGHARHAGFRCVPARLARAHAGRRGTVAVKRPQRASVIFGHGRFSRCALPGTHAMNIQPIVEGFGEVRAGPRPASQAAGFGRCIRGGRRATDPKEPA